MTFLKNIYSTGRRIRLSVILLSSIGLTVIILPNLLPLFQSRISAVIKLSNLWDGSLTGVSVYEFNSKDYFLSHTKQSRIFSKSVILVYSGRSIPGQLTYHLENPTGDLYIPEKLSLIVSPRWEDHLVGVLSDNLEPVQGSDSQKWRYDLDGKKFFILITSGTKISFETEIYYSKQRQVLDYLLKCLTDLLPGILQPAWYVLIYGSYIDFD